MVGACAREEVDVSEGSINSDGGVGVQLDCPDRSHGITALAMECSPRLMSC